MGKTQLGSLHKIRANPKQKHTKVLLKHVSSIPQMRQGILSANLTRNPSELGGQQRNTALSLF